MGRPYAAELEALGALDPAQPHLLRQRVLETLKAVLEADTALFWRAALVAGQERLASAVAVGAPRALEALLARAVGHRRCEAPTLDLAHPRPVETRQFVALATRVRWAGEARFRDSEVYQRLYGPAQIHSDLRLLVYTGGYFAGWIGALRTAGSGRFEPRDRRRAAHLVPAIRAALTAAAAFEEQHLPSPAVTVVTDGAGALQDVPAGARWLIDTPGFRERLAAHLAAFGRDPSTPTFSLDRVEASVVRLDAPGQGSYAVTLARTDAPRMRTGAALTATQHEVARAAVRGASTVEIARSLGCGVETVRTHVRKIYLRLGVSSRVGLAEALRYAPADGDRREVAPAAPRRRKLRSPAD